MNIIRYSKTPRGAWRAFILIRRDNKLWWRFTLYYIRDEKLSPPEYLHIPSEVFQVWDTLSSSNRESHVNDVEYLDGDLQ